MPTGGGDHPADGLEAAPDSQAAGGVAQDATNDVSEGPAQPDESGMPPASDTPGAPLGREPQSSLARPAPNNAIRGDASELREPANGRSEAPTDAAAADDPADSQQETPPAAHLNGTARHSATPPQSPLAGARLPAPSPARSPASGGLRSAPVPGSHSPAVAAALGVITGEGTWAHCARVADPTHTAHVRAQVQ